MNFALPLPPLAVLAAALLLVAAPGRASARDRGALVEVHLEEESIPAADLTATPTPSPSPGESSAPTVELTPSPTPSPTPEMFPEPTPIAMPTDEAPIGIGAVTPTGQISDQPLGAAIAAAQDNPARAASIRLADHARAELLAGRGEDAIRTLSRAMSVDPSDPFAYLYLGRAYIAKKDYTQAMTFLKRAEIGFGHDPNWLGETLAFEGLTYELSDHLLAAEAAYQQALAASPGNLMARVGYTRTSSNLEPTEAASPEAAPPESAAPPPPESGAAPSAPEEPPAPPPPGEPGD
jgi:Tetratricopeptide repeat